MAQRRPIASHPAFAPLVALWFAALFGLAVAVLPGAPLERLFTALGPGGLVPLTTGGRLAACAVAALAGAPVGLVLGRAVAARAAHDPRPIYAEPEIEAEVPGLPEPARRPLRVREELDEGLRRDAPPTGDGGARDDDSGTSDDEGGEGGAEGPEQRADRPVPPPLPGDGFMILSPRPVAARPPEEGLEALLARFDEALDALSDDRQAGHALAAAPTPASPPPLEPDDADPVHAFLARQAGAARPHADDPPASSGDTPAEPFPNLAPDPPSGTQTPQAALRSALDRLARVRQRRNSED